MRRKDREMDRSFGLEVIDRAQYGVLNLVDEDGKAYGVPLSIARDGEVLYFHSAKSGKKVDLIKDGSQVHLTFVGKSQVPDLITPEEVARLVELKEGYNVLTTKLFTTEFESAMVTGTIRSVESQEEKTRGLRVICEKYTPQWMQYFERALNDGLKVTAIYAIDIGEVTAKRKKFDANGEEMKWQRME